MEEERGNQWGTGCVGEGGEGGQMVSHTQLHRTVSTGLNSWEKSRSPASSCCCVLLRKPHMEPHVTASDQQQSTLFWNWESTGGPTVGLTARRSQWHNENRNTHIMRTHTTLFVSLQLWVYNENSHDRDVRRYTYVSAQWYSLLCPFRENIWVHIASHSPFCKFVRKVITALWLMLTRGSLLKGECQTQSHSCLAAAACVAHMQRQIRSLLWKTVVVQPTLHSGLQLDLLLKSTVNVTTHRG